MSFNGSGTFVINSAGQPVVANTVISATTFNALTADLANGLSTCITKDGQTTPTANIPMGGFKITNLANGTAASDAATVAQIQSNGAALVTVTGVDTLLGSLSPALTTYVTGAVYYFIAPATNTGAVTLNIDTLGAKNVTRDGTTALVAGDIVSGEMVAVVYDGTRFQLISPVNSFTNLNVSGTLTVAGATTLNGNLQVGNAAADTVNFQASGWTLTNNVSVTGTWADIGTITTADINGGTIDGTTIGGGTAAAGTFTTATATTGNITTVNATTVDSTNLEVTNLKAKDGTAAGSIADSTGVVTLNSLNATTVNIDGGTIDATIIGGASPAAGTFSNLTATNLSAASANIGVAVIGTFAATTLELTNLEVTNIKADDGTQAMTVQNVTGKVTMGTASIASANLGVATIGTLNLAEISIASANIATAIITNLTATSASVASMNAGVALLTTATVTTLTASGASIASANIGNLQFTAASIASINAGVALITTGTVTNLTSTAASIASANVGTAVITGLTATGASIASANAGVANITDLRVAGASIASANVGTAVITTGTVTNLTSTAASVASANVGVALITTGTVTTLTATGASVASANVGTAVVTGLTVTNASVASLNAGTATITTGNLTFSSTAQRITGDMTNATISNRLFFQTSTADSATRFGAIPSGTGTISAFSLLSKSDPNNASWLQLGITDGAAAQIAATLTGTGTYLPMTFFTGGSERVRIDTSGNMGIGLSSLTIPLQIGKGGGGNPATSGTTQTYGIARIGSSGAAALDVGTYAAGQVWMQGVNVTNLANNFDMVLQPNGGNVGIGTASPGATLEVTAATSNGLVRLGQLQFKNSSGLYSAGADGVFMFPFSDGILYSDNYDGGFVWRTGTGSTERMRIDSSGNVGIGGTADAFAKTRIAGTLPTGSNTSAGFYTSGTVPSGSTSDYLGFWSTSSTQATSFTLSNASHFFTSGISIGAGSTVTNQFGFRVSSGLTQATNNYGFYSDIASGSNRWNFYAAGTAQNYFAGNTGVGNAPPSNVRLQSRGASATSSDYAFGVQNSTPADLFWIRNDGLINTGLAAESPYNKTTGASANMLVDSAGALYRSTSSLRYKSDVTDATHGLADVLKLRSVTYKAKNDGDTVFGGLIAEEVHDAGLTEFVAYDKEGRPDALHYGNMVALLVKAVQELTARVAELEAK